MTNSPIMGVITKTELLEWRKPQASDEYVKLAAASLFFHTSFPLHSQARMERDMSARRIYGEEESQEGAAGSEFGKKQREEARRKKYGIVTREFKVEDQPWILKVNGKAGKRFVYNTCLYAFVEINNYF